MSGNCVITNPETFLDQEECLGIDIGDCRLRECTTLWVNVHRPRKNGDQIHFPPPNLSTDNSLRLPVAWAARWLLLPSPSDIQELGVEPDPDRVWFGLDMRDVVATAQRNLDGIRYILIPCVALEQRGIPGFREGCVV